MSFPTDVRALLVPLPFISNRCSERPFTECLRSEGFKGSRPRDAAMKTLRIINCLLSQWKSCCSTAHDSSCDICLDTCTPRISVKTAEGFCLFRAIVGKDGSVLTHSSTRVWYAARGCPISHPRFRIGKRVPWSTPPRKLIVSPRLTKGLVLFIFYQYCRCLN